MKTAVVICPGRGADNGAVLGYLGRYFPAPELLARFDAIGDARGQERVSDLDGADRFEPARHGRGDNASALIYAATLGDFLSLDADRKKVVAVSGNSMGWYSVLACAGAIGSEQGFEIVNTMGTLMYEALIGGQADYPVTGDD